MLITKAQRDLKRVAWICCRRLLLGGLLDRCENFECYAYQYSRGTGETFRIAMPNKPPPFPLLSMSPRSQLLLAYGNAGDVEGIQSVMARAGNEVFTGGVMNALVYESVLKTLAPLEAWQEAETFVKVSLPVGKGRHVRGSLAGPCGVLKWVGLPLERRCQGCGQDVLVFGGVTVLGEYPEVFREFRARSGDLWGLGLGTMPSGRLSSWMMGVRGETASLLPAVFFSLHMSHIYGSQVSRKRGPSAEGGHRTCQEA